MNGVFAQFVMVILSVGIIFTYIKPTFERIGEIQNETVTYEEEISKVLSVNSKLSDLQTKMDSVSMSDKLRLLNYMPDTLDELMVLRDLYLITNQSGALYRGVTSGTSQGGQKQKSASGENAPIQHDFSLSVEGTYTQIKSLFRLLEQNKYPLEVQDLALSSSGGGFMTATIGLTTYSFQNDITSE